MTLNNAVSGVLIDQVALSVEELARACDVEAEWVARHVRAGVLGGDIDASALDRLQFGSADLVRARRLLSLESVFDANEDIAALVLDLGDEIHRLRARLRVLGAD
ncbi:MerR family transcriptional regulator [Massilia eurypsychrophila]|jgi:chaperone modulatory protein CbpM|uniref:MerR family transcriptional regulator n=1 Tax=Massilia eurypsychrophila TaxID=1485217 RepID=A0A2G8TBP4_9BURK|nr:MerR family transcriptional regulator [Massilia eurypsychrophila]PIL43098.1 MerR family transcriptional regulator [Massilia eurypsychrophila]